MHKMKSVLVPALIGVFMVGMGFSAEKEKPIEKKKSTAEKKDPSKKIRRERKIMKAILETSMGTVVLKLYERKTPITVKNFAGLAKGTKEWIDPNTGETVKKPFYNGLTFHRVIPRFMIQGGCPLGTGTGGPGYRFEDEIVSGLVFDRPGLLAMANAGPGTNGSQFFITTVPTPWLNGKHTIFGEVLEGMDVVYKIGDVERGRGDRPVTPVLIKELRIEKSPLEKRDKKKSKKKKKKSKKE